MEGQFAMVEVRDAALYAVALGTPWQGVGAPRRAADEGDVAASMMESRRHFFPAAAEVMRGILAENARRKKRLRHGGDRHPADIDVLDPPIRMPHDELVALDATPPVRRVSDPQAAQLAAWWAYD